MHQWLNLPLQSDHFCWSKFPPAILNYQKIHGGISLCAVTGRWVATFNISSLSALSKWHTQLDWHAAKVADNAMVKLKKHSNTTVRKCGFDVQSNSPHDTWPRRRHEAAPWWRVKAVNLRRGWWYLTRGKDLVVCCGCHVCFWLGFSGQLTVPWKDKDSGGLYSVMGISKKSQSQLLLKKSG